MYAPGIYRVIVEVELMVELESDTSPDELEERVEDELGFTRGHVGPILTVRKEA
jgi:hypothetical protein